MSVVGHIIDDVDIDGNPLVIGRHYWCRRHNKIAAGLVAVENGEVRIVFGAVSYPAEKLYDYIPAVPPPQYWPDLQPEPEKA